jgi:outer membrane PBP1 activator LpoA protein
MNARQRITDLLKEWLDMTHRESHVIQLGRWSELARIQQAKAALQAPLAEAIDQWKAENPAEAASHPFRDEVGRLLALEASNGELLAVRKREVREKELLLEQALDELCRLRTACARAPEPV